MMARTVGRRLLRVPRPNKSSVSLVISLAALLIALAAPALALIITGDMIADNTITNRQVADKNLDHTSIAIGAVRGSEVADNSLTATDIANGSLSGVDIAPAQLNGGHVVDGSLRGVDIARDELNGRHVIDGSLTGADLTLHRVQAVETIYPGQWAGPIAWCPLGKKVIGGGFHSYAAYEPEFRILGSHPKSEGWEATAKNDASTSVDLYAFAICA